MPDVDYSVTPPPHLVDELHRYKRALETVEIDLNHLAMWLGGLDHPGPCGDEPCMFCWAEHVATGGHDTVTFALNRTQEPEEG